MHTDTLFIQASQDYIEWKIKFKYLRANLAVLLIKAIKK